jgi:hypothetical protein
MVIKKKILKLKKGSSLYLVILIMLALFSISVFLINITVQSTKIYFGIGNSVIAFFAADTGAEKILYDLYKGDYQPTVISCPYPEWQNLDSTGAKYSVCVASTSPKVIIWTTGLYSDTKRRIELTF